jgi:hypothetical protein
MRLSVHQGYRDTRDIEENSADMNIVGISGREMTALRMEHAPTALGRVPRLRAALRDAAPALLSYAAVRAFAVAVLGYWGYRRGESAITRLSTLWDANWYADVAVHGYDPV